ncbi:MAG: hypothetical protein JXR91_16105, partial [Deltaproteobacteria bacterium]|nr:hypothetical protein [Deltaproteobacteria bacterium]
MARFGRIKAVDSGDVFYHLYSRAAGVSGYYPLASEDSQRQLHNKLKFYAGIYRMKVAGFSFMGNHYHLVVEFEEFQELSRDELRRIAIKLYGKNSKVFVLWDARLWERFNRRLFDVSEFMRNFQGDFA